MSARYYKGLNLALGVGIWVDFSTLRGRVVNYRLVLLWDSPRGVETIRLYDSAHGYNEMHRYTRTGGEHTGEVFHSGTLGEGIQAAIEDSKRSYRQMIEGWNR